ITPCLENGKTAQVNGLDENVHGFGSTEFIVMSAKKPYFDQDYIYYLARLPEFRAYAKSHMEGTSGRQRVPWQSLAKFTFSFPPEDVRREAAIFLKRLDDKICNNNAMNQTLEKIAQRIFKSWFIDFDPVKANKEGLPFDGLSPEIQALFPSEFEDSELGMIPKGWEVSTIEDEFTTVGGATPSTKNEAFWENGNVLWTTPKDLSGLTDKVLFDTSRKITDAGLKKISSGLLPVNTVLMSSRAPVGYLALAKEKMAINQGYIALKCDKKIGEHFMLLWLDSNMESIKCRAGGTTFAEISKKAFRPIPLVVPDENILDKFEAQIKPIFDRIEANARQNACLGTIRDRLLPKLISGQISVGEAKQELAEAI
ncbi:restriction endonuclease subunit S, partial [Vibrio parahaemolyticus]